MRIGMSLNYAGGFAETVEELADYEKAGLEIVFVPEAYSFDAVSQLGFIAARTQRLADVIRKGNRPRDEERHESSQQSHDDGRGRHDRRQ